MIDNPRRCQPTGWMALTLATALALAGSAAAAQQRAEVVDGDTIVVGGERVRLTGLDTP